MDLPIADKPGYIIPFWINIMTALILMVFLSDCDGEDVSTGNWEWGWFRSTEFFATLNLFLPVQRRRLEGGPCVADGSRAPNCLLNPQIRKPSKRDSIFFLLLTVFNVKLPNGNKSIFSKIFKMLMSHSGSSQSPVKAWILSECLSKGKQTMRPSSGHNAFRWPVTASQNEPERNRSHHLVQMLASL